MTLQLEAVTLLQDEAVIAAYFQSFNAGDFETTASLFSKTGQLVAPFEDPLVGQEAIAAYLNSEAEGMIAYPKAIEMVPESPAHRRLVVRGQVSATVFKVNAAWIFDQNALGEFERVRVKLLASMQELLTLRE